MTHLEALQSDGLANDPVEVNQGAEANHGTLISSMDCESEFVSPTWTLKRRRLRLP